MDFFFWILIFSEKAFEDQWHFSGCDSANDRGHWVLTRPGKYKPIIFVLFVCLSNVSKLFYLSCTVPTQIIFKSYLPIYQNDIQLFTMIITGGAWRRFCKTQLQGAWFSTVSFFDHRKKKILLCPSFAQNIFLLCSTIAQNILSFCSTLTQNRIFKFVHLMCNIEFLGWSKSCTQYNFCSTLATKKEMVVELYCKLEYLLSPTKSSIVPIHIVGPRAHLQVKTNSTLQIQLWMKPSASFNSHTK